jgi:hypothetical protein
MKMKLSGSGCQFNGLESGHEVATLSILRLNSNPDPFSGVKSSEKADMRRTLDIGPPPGRMFAETFQLVAVSPAPCTNGGEKVTAVESKVKSPWKPTSLRLGSMNVVFTGSKITVAIGTPVSRLSVGRVTFIGVGVGVGVPAGVEVGVAVGAGV